MAVRVASFRTAVRRKLALARTLGDRQGEAQASWNLGLTFLQQGDVVSGIALMQVYVDFAEDIGHPDAAQYAAEVAEIRQWLSEATRPPRRWWQWWRWWRDRPRRGG